MKNLLLPVLLGLSLSGIGIALAYLALKKDEETYSNVRSSRQTIIEVKIPKECIGAVIGRQGSNIKSIQEKSGARINFKDESGDSQFRVCLIRGTPETAQLAESMIHEFIVNQPLTVSHDMWVPQRACGRIIGKGGETIRGITRVSCAKITVDSATSDPERHTETRVLIRGTAEQIAFAQSLIEEKVKEDDELRQKLDFSAANRPVRKSPKESQNYLMAPPEEQVKNVTERTERLQANTNDGFLDVFVSAFESPEQFWVQLVNQHGVELDHLVDKATEFYCKETNRIVPSASEVYVGQMLIAPFYNDGKWYRAKVLSIELNEYDPLESILELYYVDYGDSCSLKIKEVSEIRTDFLTLYFQAIECFLAGVKPSGNQWSDEALNVFEELAEVALWRKKGCVVTCYRDGSHAKGKRSGSPVPGVELHDFEKNINIGEELVKRGLAIWEKESCSKEENLSVSSPRTSKSKENSVAQNLVKSVESQPASSISSSQTFANEEAKSSSSTRSFPLGSAFGKQNSSVGYPVGLPATSSLIENSNKNEVLTTGVNQSSTNTHAASTMLNGKNTAGSSSASFIHKESGIKSSAPPGFKPRTLESKPKRKEIPQNTHVEMGPVVYLPEPLSDDELYDDEDDLGFSMG